MLQFILAPENAVFSAALALVLLIGIVEMIGLGGSVFEIDADGDAHTPLDWLNVGRLPLLALLVLIFWAFGITGYAVQLAAQESLGTLLSAWIAAVPAAISSIIVTRLLSRPLARVLPRDETTAVSSGDLSGRRATVMGSLALRGQPAEATVRDQHGQTHYIMVEPHTDGGRLIAGDEVLLVTRRDKIFLAAALEERPLA